MKEKDEADWDVLLDEYQQTQKQLFAMNFDDIDDDDIAEVRSLLAHINQINDTLIGLSRPFYKKISEELKQLKSGKKVSSAYNENSD